MTAAGETTAGRPRDSRIDTAVLAAARELLADVGYADLTLTAVAARAQTSVPAVRRRWPSKAHIVHHAVFPTERLTVPPDENSTLADEVAGVVDNCAAVVSDPAMRRAITGLLSDLAADKDLERELSTRMNSVVSGDLGARFVAAARRDGTTLRLDPSMVAEVAFGATLMTAVMHGAEGLDARWRAQMTAMLLAGG
ncbi:TetR/AcrR family transcriptional regulator [Gordonia sp. TBRC 11910]|uniref:TetR/AcrR family transcriptional regulator n=2 Tax=Gordonia asplenii TaxID=2725283 RepID=A0A848KXN8_9ACTN|nr:TetR/AcrR family transcriptional regulator [Gordonia asplenii]